MKMNEEQNSDPKLTIKMKQLKEREKKTLSLNLKLLMLIRLHKLARIKKIHYRTALVGIIGK